MLPNSIFLVGSNYGLGMIPKNFGVEALVPMATSTPVLNTLGPQNQPIINIWVLDIEYFWPNLLFEKWQHQTLQAGPAL